MPSDKTTADADVWKGLQAQTADIVHMLERENARLQRENARLRAAIRGAQTAHCYDDPDGAMRILVETGVQNVPT